MLLNHQNIQTYFLSLNWRYNIFSWICQSKSANKLFKICLFVCLRFIRKMRVLLLGDSLFINCRFIIYQLKIHFLSIVDSWTLMFKFIIYCIGWSIWELFGKKWYSKRKEFVKVSWSVAKNTMEIKQSKFGLRCLLYKTYGNL